MTCSPARLAANKLNAKRSSGPSVQGRLRSRLNALKHGLTGAGIALPNEDLAEIERRSNALHDELRPHSELARLLVGRVAFLAVRLDRCQRHDTAMLARRVRNAGGDHAEERLDRIRALIAEISHDPVTTVRRLSAVPEGVAWLVENFGQLRRDLAHEDETVWGMAQCVDLHLLMGLPRVHGQTTRYQVLSDTGRGFYGHLKPGECEGMTDPEKVRWARGELLAVIDGEIARLKEIGDSLDLDEVEQDRAEAADRALFDPSKEAVLARKYEAATERSLFRTLRELAEVRAMELPVDEAEEEPEGPPEPGAVPEPTSGGRGSLGSFFQAALAPSEVAKTGPDFPDSGDPMAVEGRSVVASGEFSPKIE